MSDTFSPSNAMHQETGCARRKEASRDFHRRPRRARHLIYRSRWWWEGKALCIIRAVELVQCSRRHARPGALRWPSPPNGLDLVSSSKFPRGGSATWLSQTVSVTANDCMARAMLRHVGERAQMLTRFRSPVCTCSGVVCMHTFSYDTRSSLPPILCTSHTRNSVMHASVPRWWVKRHSNREDLPKSQDDCA